MMRLDDVRVSAKLAGGFGVVLVLLGAVGGLALHQASRARSTAEGLGTIAGQLHAGGAMATAVNRLRANALAYLVDPSEHRAAKYREKAAEADAAMKAAQDSLAGSPLASDVEALERDVKAYETLFDKVIADRTEIDRLYVGTMDPTGLKAADEFYQSAKAADKAGDLASASACYEGVLEMNRTRVRIQRYLISRKPEDYDNAVKAAEKCTGLLAAAAKDAKPEHKERLESGVRQFGEFLAAAAKVHDLTDGIEHVRRDKLDPIASKVSDKCGELSVALRDEAGRVQDSSLAALSRSRTQTASLIAAAVGFGSLSAFLIARSIGRPVRTIAERLRDIAQGEGDLTRRLEVDRKDEFGSLCVGFNTFVTRVHEVVKDVASATTVLHRASGEIAAASEEMAGSLSQQCAQTQQVSAAVEELSSTVAEVARQSEQASGAATGARADADQGGKVVSQTVDEMKQISAEVATSANAVNDLGSKSEEIGKIIGVINDIADQTNLLALNAAIEAARAGDHGRGFAVVADEVRKLAERTTRATGEVASSIRDIQSGTSSAVKLIESGVSRVARGVDLASSAGGALTRIVENSDKVGSMVMSIASAATEQSAAAEEIARSIEQINASSVQTADGAQQSARSASDLRTQADRLAELVRAFKI